MLCGICLTRQNITQQASQADLTRVHTVAQNTEDRSMSTQVVSLCPSSGLQTSVSCDNVQDEVEEVEAKLEASEQQPRTKLQRILNRLCTPVFLEALILTFLAGKNHDACRSCRALCRQGVLSCVTHLQYKTALSQWARSSDYSLHHRVTFRYVLAVMLASYPFSKFLAEPEFESYDSWLNLNLTWTFLLRTAVQYMFLLHIVLENNLQSGVIGVK